MNSAYRGRFAPSPTGALHFGSLVAAMASYLDAKVQGGKWLVRMEDVDAPRCSQEAACHILKTLEAFGFFWDEEVIYQSHREDIYRHYLTQLQMDGKVYPCACSRKEVEAQNAGISIDGTARYNGRCKEGMPEGAIARAWRFFLPNEVISFDDRVYGLCTQNPQAEVGDMILLRADGIVSYQLAVVVDDALQNITHIVRGGDILNATHRQIALQQALGFQTPRYAHIPVVVTSAGEKLSKQTHARAIDPIKALATLSDAFIFLGGDLPKTLELTSVTDFWRFALRHWRISHTPKVRAMSPMARAMND